MVVVEDLRLLFGDCPIPVRVCEFYGLVEGFVGTSDYRFTVFEDHRDVDANFAFGLPLPVGHGFQSLVKESRRLVVFEADFGPGYILANGLVMMNTPGAQGSRATGSEEKRVMKIALVHIDVVKTLTTSV